MAQVPSIGKQDSLDVATWNIQTFGFSGFGPDEEAQFKNVLDVIRSADIDLWAVQEMGDDACLPTSPGKTCFQSLVDSLDGYDGEVGPVLGSNGFVRTGFIYNRDIITPVTFKHILLEDSVAFRYRPPYLLEADVSLNGSTERISFITLHMWPGVGESEHGNRELAGQKLREYVGTELASENVIILGDFNDRLTEGITAGKASPYEQWVADSLFQFLTLPLEENGEASFIPFGSFIDHIVLNKRMKGFYVESLQLSSQN